jgi:hypothetical protein
MDGSPLQRYMMQRKLAAQGGGPSGGGGQPAVPMGPGIADPFNEGQDAPAMVNPDDGMNEFDPRRRRRPYMDDFGPAQMPAQITAVN